jgi:hypothetical protein
MNRRRGKNEWVAAMRIVTEVRVVKQELENMALVKSLQPVVCLFISIQN